MVDSYMSLIALPALPSESRHLQHNVERYLASLESDPCGETLGRRAQRFSGAVPLTDDEDILVSTIFCRLGPHIPLCSLSSFLQTLTDSWCPSGRFGTANSCIACRTPRGDHIQYIIECPLSKILRSLFPASPIILSSGTAFQGCASGALSPCPLRPSSIALFYDVVC